MRQFRRNLFGCASRTRREQSIRPKISRIDFDLTELENSEVWSGPPKPVVGFGTGLRDEPRNHSKVERRALKFFAAPLRTMEWEAAILERGHAEMARLGMAAVELDFVDVVAHVCAAVETALVALVPGATSTCVEQVSHMAASKRHEGLAGRVGPAAARQIEDALAGTPYAWMLDLKATAWPDGALRPEPIAHPDGPRPRALRGDVV